MKVIVIGLGVQGHKRKYNAGSDFVASVDTVNVEANYNDIFKVPLTHFDAALVCLPDQPKYKIIKYLLENDKHVLVEKPLWCDSLEQLNELYQLAIKRKLVCYTAYNHRFEPHFVRMKQLIDSGKLGKIYHCRLFYGNGTARLVRNSAWRDKGMGVITDLMPHLLDISTYWFGAVSGNFEIVLANSFENRSFDHVVINNNEFMPQLMFETSLLSWRNHFTCDVFAEKGSAHIESLCKWGPSKFTYRQRVLPSGQPPEEVIILTQEDPTWAIEYRHFQDLIHNNIKTDLSNDRAILQQLKQWQWMIKGVPA